MSPEKEPVPEYPYSCPGCEANLGQRGAVFVWIESPERLVGHIEPGEGDGVNLALDVMERNQVLRLECAICNEDLDDLTVEEMFLDVECEIGEDDELGENGNRE